MPTSENTISNSFTSNHSKRLVSIDPGVNNLGLATFEGTKLIDYNVKVIPYAPSVRGRIQGIEEVLSRYLNEKQPQAIAVEKTAFSSATNNGLLVLAYYKILAIAKRNKLPVYEYMPLSIRKSVCGDGHATKSDVMKVLIRKYPELRLFAGANRRWKERQFFNLYDAVAVGVTHLIRTSAHVNTNEQ